MNTKPFSYILGPCSAESQSQIMEIAEFIAPITNLRSMRAGVWKPRTRPNGFEGYGEQALVWLQQAQQKYKIKVATEVANAHHLELCLKYGIDEMWIGARTSCNPFSVQEIAEALKGSSNPIFVKNPITPDLALWLGAIERIEKSGVSQVIAVHRGFDRYHSAPYRNSPLWEIPIEVKRQRPDLQLFCDPSHICGKTELIADICQNAINFEMDGLMLELHPDPSHAFTDAKQQLTFTQWDCLLHTLNFKSNDHLPSELQKLRLLIDGLDEDLLSILQQRLEIAKKMGILKKQENLSVLQMDRWTEIVKTRLNSAKEKGLDEHFIHELLQCIHQASIRAQE
ncbi:MAG: chorismate mutase [Bacteroidales bacterium]